LGDVSRLDLQRRILQLIPPGLLSRENRLIANPHEWFILAIRRRKTGMENLSGIEKRGETELPPHEHTTRELVIESA